MFGAKKKSKLAAVVDSTRVATRRSSAALTSQVDDLLASLADKVADARSSLSGLAEDGATAASSALEGVVKESKKSIKALDKRWQKMEPRHKVAVVGGLLAVLAAAAAAPAVARRVRAAR